MLRDMTLLQIVLAVLGIGALIAWHEFGHYLLARLLGMRVIRYSIGMGPKLVGFTRGEIEYQVAAFPFGGYVQIFGMSPLEEGALDDPRSYSRRPRWARFLVIAAGPVFNYALAAALFFAAFWFWPGSGHTISKVVEGRPAAMAGLHSDDVIVAVDGAVIHSEDDFPKAVQASEGRPLTLAIGRVNEAGQVQRLDIPVTPLKDEAGVYRVGVELSFTPPRTSIGETAQAAVAACVRQSVTTLQALGSLVKGHSGVQMSGPIGIVQQISHQVDRGARSFVLILAVLSTTLGLFNLLPVPALDGMKLLLIAIEGAIRRDISPTFQLWLNAGGAILVFGLIIVMSVYDVAALIKPAG